LDAFHIERVLYSPSRAAASTSGSVSLSPDEENSDSVSSTEMSAEEVALVDTHIYDDLPVRFIHISNDFTGTLILMSDDSLEFRRLSIHHYPNRSRTPIFGTFDSLWCALYLRRTEGGPRAQVVGTQVDLDRKGFEYFAASYLHPDGNMFQGEDIGENSLVLRSVAPLVYHSGSEGSVTDGE
jgi:hypothetical protein